MNRIIRSLSCALLLIPAVAPAQLLPLDVHVTGDTATVRVGPTCPKPGCRTLPKGVGRRLRLATLPCPRTRTPCTGGGR